eukprot:CAMPEP_0194294212 /NCGR_PEP_ID=MMETSP0169-20130528/49991_1 /TAXON_ID=218684 /ORGANISM="Corethron pennatum, Strain L29A3" /LENGTH=119 /DNA_ID=CAMNT_0039042991 /DNA_START=24 /DNA_END=380 /DNA_ORIENTATION=-
MPHPSRRIHAAAMNAPTPIPNSTPHPRSDRYRRRTVALLLFAASTTLPLAASIGPYRAYVPESDDSPAVPWSYTTAASPSPPPPPPRTSSTSTSPPATATCTAGSSATTASRSAGGGPT